MVLMAKVRKTPVPRRPDVAAQFMQYFGWFYEYYVGLRRLMQNVPPDPVWIDFAFGLLPENPEWFFFVLYIFCIFVFHFFVVRIETWKIPLPPPKKNKIKINQSLIRRDFECHLFHR